MNDIEKRIIEVINNLQPYLVSDGGDIEFVKYADNIVYVRLKGACASCFMQDSTLKDGIEDIIREEIDDNIRVVNVL